MEISEAKSEGEEYPDSVEECHRMLRGKDREILNIEAAMEVKEQEIDEMVENFNISTNILLERIKNMEEEYVGVRPQTAMILDKADGGVGGGGRGNVKSLVEDRRNQQKLNMEKSGKSNILTNPLRSGLLFSQLEDQTMRKCHNCKKEFPDNELKKHTIFCYRTLVRCKKCGKELSKSMAPEHLAKWRNKSK